MDDYRKPGIIKDLEEQLSKQRAVELWDLGVIDTFEVGTFHGLQQVHEYLFQDVFIAPGVIRNVDLAKGNFRFASCLYLAESIPVVERAFTIDEMMDADEILVTSSGNLLTFANEVNGQSVGGKDPRTLARLRNAVYQDFMNYTGLTKLF